MVLVRLRGMRSVLTIVFVVARSVAPRFLNAPENLLRDYAMRYQLAEC